MAEAIAADGALSVLCLGRTPYPAALARQRELHERRKAGRVADTLLLTEHEPVLTLGRRAGHEHIRAAPAELDRLGIAVVPVERGGDVTYHGPGQLVAYPILDLRPRGGDVRAYVRALEESAIRLLAGYGVEGARREGTPGVWAAGGKIAAVGVFISRWVTMHGIAINLDPNLRHFDLIDPCGFPGLAVSSVAAETGRHIAVENAASAFAAHFAQVFDETLAARPSAAGGAD